MRKEGTLGALIPAVLAGCLAFVFRALTESQLPNDHYMHLAWAQQLLFGEMPGRDFVDPGMPLMYVLSALVQRLWPGPFSELMLACAMIGIAAGLTYWLVASLTESRVAGLVAVFIEVAIGPRLYSYPKVLVPAIVLAALWAYVHKPSARRLWLLGASTAVAFCLRHDLGAFAFASVVVALIVAGPGAGMNMIQWLTRYALVTAAVLTPYLVFVQYSQGLVDKVREGLEFGRGESHQLLLSWSRFPALDLSDPLSAGAAASWLFYMAYWFVILGGALVVLRRRHLSRETTATVAAAVILLALYCAIILRHPLGARVPDLAALLAIVGTWSLFQAVTWIRQNHSAARLRTAFLVAATAFVALTTTVAALELGTPGARIVDANLLDGIPTARRRFKGVVVAGTEWPWSWYWPAGPLPAAVEYLNACTDRSDRVLLTWPAAEYYFFARRGFGAGHALFSGPEAFSTPRDRQKMVARIQHEHVPVVLINETTRREFAATYPELDLYLRQHYVPAGMFTIRDDSTITIAVRRELRALGSYGPEAWPCRFESRDRGSGIGE